MDLATVTAIRPELEAALTGRKFGKLFQLSKFELVIDLRLPESRYLFVSVEPGNPRVYLIKRRLRDLEKASVNPTPFLLTLRKRLSGATSRGVAQIEGERALLFAFDGEDDLGERVTYTLAVQLTGRSANLFLLDESSRILDASRTTRGEGQQAGDTYDPPKRDRQKPAPAAERAGELNISERLDAEDIRRTGERSFELAATAARSKLKQEIARRHRLVSKLNEDLAAHGDAERWKRFGDLLLANAATARRERDKIIVTDYFDDATPEIEIEADENDSITEAAEKYFKRYAKARNAGSEIEKRLREIESELTRLAKESDLVESAISDRNEDALLEITGIRDNKPKKRNTGKRDAGAAGTRTFVSSEGFEILVGKKAKDNDFLTFRIAKSLDTWMHAADYPGSHVVIRNPNRKEVPHRTLLEAAQLAAFYSQGKTQPKAAVHYTQKKFVNKPKGSAPGLVSLASFKTILVEPKIGTAKLAEEQG